MCQCGVQLENDPRPREDFPALEDHKSFRVFDMLEKQTQVLEVVCIREEGRRLEERRLIEEAFGLTCKEKNRFHVFRMLTDD